MEHPLSVTAWRKSSYSGTGGGNCIEVGQSWRKSTYSGSSGNSCVEVGQAWRKSTYSGSHDDNCVEVGQAQAVLVRDTTNRKGPSLTIPATAWRAFTARLQCSESALPLQSA
jgi:hypothetical protein